MTDMATVLIGIISLIVLWRWKPPEPLLVAVAAVVGVLLHRG